MKLKLKKGMSLVSLGITIPMLTLIIFATSSIAMKAYDLYNNYNIRRYVLSENIKFNKALGGIRFATNVRFIDEEPVDSTNLSQINLDLPESQSISFVPVVSDNPEDIPNDINFISNGQEVYTYDQEYIDFKEFKLTLLDDTINRTSIKIDIIMGVDGKENDLARTKFGEKKYLLDYTTTLTLRNNASQ